MSRYIGPRLKVMRALGVELPGLSRKAVGENSYPPGQHGMKQKRKSAYGLKLIEKQKLCFNYGLRESQLRRLFREAKDSKFPTGNKLLELLERRIDNAVFRAGFAPTGVAARQLVLHKHILLNGRVVNIPSIRLRVGDTITLTEKAQRMPMVLESREQPVLSLPEWLNVNDKVASATMSRLPEANEVPFPVNVQDVVEYYAVRM